ncbi:tyrosine-protein kinase-like [Glandiceps talaboti]
MTNDDEAGVVVNDVQKWIIKGCELKIGDLVGIGGFGSVYKAKYLKPEAPEIIVAVKKLSVLQNRQKSKRLRVNSALSTHSVFLTDVAVDVCKGMQYLHDKHVIHRDIAARNVLIYGEHRIGKLCDFGLSRDVYTYVYKKKLKKDSYVKLPLRWMAPETLDGDFLYSDKSDIWCLGVLMWEISSLGRRPYEDIRDEHILQMLKLGKRLPRMPGCPQDLYET